MATCAKLISKARAAGKRCNKGRGKSCMQALIARHAVTRAGCKVSGTLGGCTDKSGRFIPVPQCRGRRPAKKATAKKCPNGRSKITGKCLKHPRRK